MDGRSAGLDLGKANNHWEAKRIFGIFATVELPIRVDKEYGTQRLMRITRKAAGRLVLALFCPLLSLLLYWQRLHGDYSTIQVLVASCIAIAVAASLYLYAPFAQRIRLRSLAGVLLLIAIITIGIVGFVFDAKPWGFPVTFMAIWAPVCHSVFRQGVR